MTRIPGICEAEAEQEGGLGMKPDSLTIGGGTRLWGGT
jgi:hypothetical protein